MNRLWLSVLAFLTCMVAGAFGDQPLAAEIESAVKVLPADTVPNDSRLGELKTLKGHFPFAVPDNPAAWYARAEKLRRRVLVANGLWPMPEKPPIDALIFGKVQRDGFTVEKVAFQSLPGHFVTGLLFRPDDASDADEVIKRPGVLSPHGHGGRNQAFTDKQLAEQLESGGEHFAKSGRTPKLARCAQLARMGCVTFIFDMLGYGDSMQISYEIAHRHASVRPEESAGRPDGWIFFSPEADLRLQSIMGLQTWNAIRALDFLESLPDVDTDRLAVTGGSGGGTQSILMGAIDDRIKVSFPNGMVSTSMQGGCYCENCNLLRVGTGNVELAALFAPRPQAMTAADDWTRDMMTDGYPQLKWLYAMIGDEDDVDCRPLLQFPHNYNYVTRATMYQWMNRHLQLGLGDPVVEQDFEPFSAPEITVWDASHPEPTQTGIPHEQSVCRWMDQQAQMQLALDGPMDAESLAEFRTVVGGAWQTMMGCEIPTKTRYEEVSTQTSDYGQLTKGLVRDPQLGSELPLLTLTRDRADAEKRRFVIWTCEGGKASALAEANQPGSSLHRVLNAGYTVLLPDLFLQGEFLKDRATVSQQRVIEDPRPYSAFTFGYNPTLVASRCADLLSVVAHARDQKADEIILVAGEGSAAWAAPAAAIAGAAIDHAVIRTGGFRFETVENYRDPNFVPGAVKYGDLPAILALRAPHSLTVLGTDQIPEIVVKAFEASGKQKTSQAFDTFDALVATSNAKASADFPELFNTEPISDETLMSAQEAAAKFQLPSGFHATAFASEPEVQNPIAMSWDSRGRLWVAENYTYAERSQRFQLDLRDRVVVFDGADGDHVKKRTVFTDNVQMLTGLEVGHDGVWLMCPPKLIFIPDRDHDDVPDNEGEVVLDGFEVAQANYHNFANGLRFGPDGWLYGRCGGSCPGRIGKPGAADHQRLALEGGIWRYHPTSGQTEVLTTGTTNPWGHDWNAVGEMFFVNTVNGHLWHMIPGAHFTRPFTLDPNMRTYELIDFHADHWHFDTSGAWNESRDGVANAFGGGHAHSGTMIYRGGRWPDRYDGKLFTLNFHGRRANQENLQREGSGYIARHDDDFLIAADPWFRGMELASGPDGNVFVLDWSDAGECHEHTGVHRTSGRIYKVSYEDDSDASRLGDHLKAPRSDLRTWTDAELVDTHGQPNDWYVRQARLELARRRAMGNNLSDAIKRLKLRLASDHDPSTEVQLLLTLHVVGGTEPDDLISQLNSENEHVRSWAIRMLTESWTIDDALGSAWLDQNHAIEVVKQAAALLPTLCEVAETESSASVRLTLASTLQRLPVPMRASLARKLVTHADDADDHNLPLMIWYGLIPVAAEDAGALVNVAKACELPTTRRLIARCLAEQLHEQPLALDRLLEHTVTIDDPTYSRDILGGVAEGVRGWRSAPKPATWDAISQKLATSDVPELQSLVRELSVVFGDGRALDELKRIVKGEVDADAEMKLSALSTLIQSQPDDLRPLCQSLLRDPRMNVLAAQGLSKFDDPEIGTALVSRYSSFRAPQRPKIVSILVSRVAFATALISAIEKEQIPRQDLSAYQVRQIHSLGDKQLSRKVAEVWGEVRDTPEAKQQSIDEWKKHLTRNDGSSANKSNGRELFKKACQTCHRLYGEGAQVGPDLTGSDRGNLDYLLTNIIDPSAVVDKDFRMSILLLDDDRIVNGLVVSETPRTITLQTATEQMTIETDTIQSRKLTEKSPMPDGLLEALQPDQIRDLIAYLRHPHQVPLPE